MSHPKALVARIKGALRILRPKQIAYLTGIPAKTISKWGSGDLRGQVPAEDGKDLEALLNRFLGTRK